ncbi:unnamed protein product [Rotaria sordida]|uniref:Uncharacterized protein n=1 Tax=Rotaria sordida TaxID=392033 RepID=A0A815IQ47_9BILA|nr:unnamed protein product [Rotaria sordida]CAF1368561.1 unnamed protein product [Rotaria sordida]
MNKKSIITCTVFMIFHITLSQGLECYQHNYCLGNCPELSNSTVECAKDESRCWKITSPLGTMRGCGKHRCEVQINVGIFDTANVCCFDNLCNSSVQIKLTTASIFLTSLITFIYTWCFK